MISHSALERARAVSRRGLRILGGGLAAVLLAQPTLAAAEITDGVIRIGIMADVVGPYSQSSGQGSMVAVELAAEEFGNEINGNPIEVVIGDTKNKPDIAVELVTQMHKDGVDMVTDIPSSAVALAVQKYVTENTQMIIMHNGAGTELLTGKFCSPQTVQWQYNTRALSASAAALSEERKGSKWFVITLDHPFGRGIYNDIETAITPNGGKIVGAKFHGFTEANFFPILEEAMASDADVIAFGNAGKGLIEAIRQSKEIGVALRGKQLVSVMTLMQDIRGVGLYASSGMRFVAPYYWNATEGSRKFAERFRERMGVLPSEAQIADYTAALHYLKAVKASGSDQGAEVVTTMRKIKIDDGINENAYLREDGRLVHDVYFVEVKRASESNGLMDYYHVLGSVSGEKAFGPPSADCSLVKS